jgi:transketolase
MHELSEPWADLRRRAILRLLRMHYESGVGHLGGNLSCLDVMLVLHHDVLGPSDQFVLSKGHSAGAYYIALWSIGKLEETDLQQFHKDGTRLSGHPPTAGIAEILFATGSLGHGLSLAAGLALAKQLKGEAGRVYCLMSDGEWNEGSCWEALIFALHRRLGNLTIAVDLNGLQGFGTTREVADLDPLADKFRAFGASTNEIAGHDPDAIRRAMAQDGPAPRVVVAHTHKAYGISFLQDRMDSHYRPLTELQYLQAVREVAGNHKPYGISIPRERVDSQHVPLTGPKYLQATRETEGACEKPSVSRS